VFQRTLGEAQEENPIHYSDRRQNIVDLEIQELDRNGIYLCLLAGLSLYQEASTFGAQPLSRPQSRDRSFPRKALLAAIENDMVETMIMVAHTISMAKPWLAL
jgi:hypothetical protein